MSTEKKTAAAAPRKKVKKQLAIGVVHVKASFNNTKITLTDLQGNVMAWSSSAKEGFKGSRKSTPFAAQVAADVLAKDSIEKLGLKQVHVRVNGPGPGRESAIRAIGAAGVKLLSIEDVTGIPHNGCRDSKKRRV
jgi:small subunit ribosomal protein S11